MKSLVLIPLLIFLALPAMAANANPSSTGADVKTLVWPDGTRYEGGVKDGKRDGMGTIFWNDGTRFVGNFKNDKREGTGSMILPDGTVYNGFFRADKLVNQSEGDSSTVATITSPAGVQSTPPPPAKVLAERVVTIDDTAKSELMTAVDSWAAAWSSQNVPLYLAFYSDDFSVPRGQARGDWEANRRTRLSTPGYIKLDLVYIDFSLVSPDLVDVSFNQAYQSDTYSDNANKTLRLRKEGGSWKILRERSN